MGVLKYKTKPIIKEAIRFTGTMENFYEIKEWSRGNVSSYHGNGVGGVAIIQLFTVDGKLTVRPGGWIIKGVGGEFYPCLDEIFQETYEVCE
jgi:hypothetical protein